jgi:lipopolysaccharide transport system permease protein
VSTVRRAGPGKIQTMSESRQTGTVLPHPPARPLEAATRIAGRPERRDTAIPWGLIWTLVRTDFKARYHGTLSGFLWALLKPLTMFAVLMAVFSIIFQSEPTYKLDLLIGLFLWEFFAEGTKVGLIALHAKGFLLTKARFPSWILVVASISNPLITILVFCVAVITLLVVTAHPLSLAAVALFLTYVVAMSLVIVGFSLGASVLFLRYRDLNQVWEVVIQAGFFVTPIIYPIGVISEAYHFYLYLWPPTAVIEFSRSVLVDGRIPSFVAHVDLFGLALAILALGAIVYRRFSPRAAEFL